MCNHCNQPQMKSSNTPITRQTDQSGDKGQDHLVPMLDRVRCVACRWVPRSAPLAWPDGSRNRWRHERCTEGRCFQWSTIASFAMPHLLVDVLCPAAASDEVCGTHEAPSMLPRYVGAWCGQLACGPLPPLPPDPYFPFATHHHTLPPAYCSIPFPSLSQLKLV